MKHAHLTCTLIRQAQYLLSRFLVHLHLDAQINRATLDFDFEKVCSVSLSNINIYGCLVCGKYFQGRGRKSYAYAHSIHDDHHVFINLETTKACCILHSYHDSFLLPYYLGLRTS